MADSQAMARIAAAIDDQLVFDSLDEDAKSVVQ